MITSGYSNDKKKYILTFPIYKKIEINLSLCDNLLSLKMELLAHHAFFLMSLKVGLIMNGNGSLDESSTTS